MIRILYLGSSCLLFILSLCQECFTVNGEKSIGSFGLMAFSLGLFDSSQSFIVWLANPFYFLTILLILFKKRIAVISALLAFIFAISFLVLNNVIINEGGTIGEVDNYLLGYWLWISSIAILTLGIMSVNKLSLK